MTKRTTNRNQQVQDPWTIAEIKVAGFKSINEEHSIEIRPLTILAGANSSGKSSMIQPLLLLKQTLEAPYDPGPILLNGPNVKFTSADQLLSRTGKGQSLDSFSVGMMLNTGNGFLSCYRKEHKLGFRIESMDFAWTRGPSSLWPEMTAAEIEKTGITEATDFSHLAPAGYRQGQWVVRQEHCFLEPAWLAKNTDGTAWFSTNVPISAVWRRIIPEIIHLPGLRGSPERTYPMTAVGPTFPGTFERYSASVIADWMENGGDALNELSKDLQMLKLTGGVAARRLNDAQIEIQVGRLPDVVPTRPDQLVNIADVGVGVSQTLPVLVALHAAKPHQLVYVEQPETHLHPRAQVALAQVLAAAAKRGVRVVVETHSSLLLLGIQTLVAEGKLDQNLVKLHWFQREKNGRTVVRSADLDEAGRTGDWPEDFDDVSLHAQKEYLDAADRRLFAQ
jgi:hypothetical protein